MKYFTSLLTAIIVLTMFSNCSSAQFDKKAPLAIKNAFYQNWVGGRPGVKGTLVQIELEPSSKKEVQFDSLFFRGRKFKLQTSVSENKLTLTSSFKALKTKDKNIIMDADPREEMANKPMANQNLIPFELADNECVISYIVNHKKAYYKIANLKKEKSFKMQ